MRTIFRWYLECGSVRLLQARQQAAGMVSKRRGEAFGKQAGGLPFMRGALYKILKSRVYLGEIPHKDV